VRLYRCCPPEASMRCAFTQPISGDSSDATTPPMSSGSPARPSAVSEATISFTSVLSRTTPPEKSVSMAPGAMAFAASLLSSYSLIAARLDDTCIQRLKRGELPEGWRAYPAPSELQRIGDEWVESRRSVVLEVPSVIVEDESIYLINPVHPEFSSVSVGEPKPFYFDHRVVSRRQ